VAKFCSSPPQDTGGHLIGNPSRNGLATPTAGFGVNTVTGNYFHQEIDATLPGKEIPFVFTRAYNSLSDNKDSFGAELPQPLGPNWTHAYNIHLRTNDSENFAEIVWGDGRRDGFTKINNTWQATTPGNFATLEQNPWEVKTKAQIRYRFDDNKRLTQIIGRNDHKIQLAYQGDNLDTITDTAGRTIKFTHDNGQLTKIQLPGKTALSRTLEFSYTNDGLLEEVTDPKGNRWPYSYTDGKLRRIYRANAKPGGDTKIALQITYDNQGRVKTQETGHNLTTDGSGEYSYNWSTSQLNYQTPTGKGADFVWDEQQRVIEITPINTPDAKTQDIQYLSDSGPGSILPTQTEDKEDHLYTLTYDEKLDLEKIKQPDERLYGLTYSNTHDLTALKTPKGVDIGLPRNEAGKPTAITASGGDIQNPINTSIKYYNTDGLLQQINTANGIKTEVAAYSADGQPKEVRRYVNDTYLSTYYEYDAAGRLTKETDHRGTLTCYDYDDNDNLTHLIQGLTGSCPTDFAAQPATSAVRHTCYGYDDNNRLISTTEGCGGDKARTRTYTYGDNTGVLHRFEDHNGNRGLDFTYNKDLQLWRIDHDFKERIDRFYQLQNGQVRISANFPDDKSAAMRIERRKYDNNGQLISVSSCRSMDQRSEPSSGCEINTDTVLQRYFWDELGRVTQILETIQTGTRRATNYSYSADGRTITIDRPADADRKEIYEYDGLGRLIKATQKKGSQTYTATAEYDASGRLTKVTDPQELQTIYTYDGLNRLLSRQDVQGTMRWTYDDQANTVTQQMDGDTAIITYTYNHLNELVQIAATDNSFQFEYNSRGQLAKESWRGTGGKGKRTYKYNVYGERLKVKGPFKQAITYEPDGLGRVETKTFGGDTVTYTYDAFDRIETMSGFMPSGQIKFKYDQFTGALTNVKFPNGVETIYKPNPIGEIRKLRTSNPNGGNHLNYDFDLPTENPVLNIWRRDQITAEQPIAPSFTPETLEFGYDSERLNTLNGSAVTYDKRGNLTALPAPLAGTYSYDALNRLTKAGKTKHRYDSARNRIQTKRQGTITRYVLDMNKSLPDVLYTMNKKNKIQDRYLHGPGGLLAHKDIKGKVRFIHQDFNANVVAMTDGDGNIESAYAYTPYGRDAGKSGDSEIPFRFGGAVGAMTDPEGLIYMRARYYHPGLRQFMSADLVPGELSRPQSLGRYAYVEGMAMTGTDPSGLSPEWCQSLRKLVEYDDKFGYFHTTRKYHPLNNKFLTTLNYDIPSIYGDVDVDWMLRLSYTQQISIERSELDDGFTYLNYVALKFAWNTGRAISSSYDLEYKSILQFANANAPRVLIKWRNGENLKEIFAPALEQCSIEKSGVCPTYPTTYRTQ
jgi:RHS repeat-associated protein